MIEEARAAVAWIYRNAPSFSGDRRRIHVAGTSAGAHLAAMTLGTHWLDYGLPADVVKGGLLVSGIYDFEPLTYHQFPDPAELFRDVTRQLEQSSYRWLSPMVHLPHAACQAVVAVGEEEPAEFRRQSIDYYDALRKHGVAAQLLISPGHDHFSIVGEWGRLSGALARATLLQLGLA
jgi:arylformamidase